MKYTGYATAILGFLLANRANATTGSAFTEAGCAGALAEIAADDLAGAGCTSLSTGEALSVNFLVPMSEFCEVHFWSDASCTSSVSTIDNAQAQGTCMTKL